MFFDNLNLVESLACARSGFGAHQDPDLIELLPFAVELEEGTDLEVAGSDVEALGDPGPFLKVSETSPPRNTVIDNEGFIFGSPC